MTENESHHAQKPLKPDDLVREENMKVLSWVQELLKRQKT